MDELVKLLHISCAPGSENKDFIRVTCGVAFEPHGRASEAWEIFWKLVLPFYYWSWKSTTGWRRGNTDDPMEFTGRTFESVVSKAIAFLKESKYQE
jgi:hypothetical protein